MPRALARTVTSTSVLLATMDFTLPLELVYLVPLKLVVSAIFPLPLA
jgi:hypothetical protein